jgi:hypothetical protein
MHLNVNLTRNIEIGASREDGQEGLEVVRTDNLKTVRNSRTEYDPRRYEIAGYTCTADNEDFIAIRQMWRDTERGNHTFNFHDWIDEETVKVRFESPLRITSPAGHLFKIETFTLIEADE